MSLNARYQDALRNIPSPGAGCHPAILGAATLGIISGIDPHQIHNDIRQAIPPGKRRISDREITDAINKALGDHHRVNDACSPLITGMKGNNNGKQT